MFESSDSVQRGSQTLLLFDIFNICKEYTEYLSFLYYIT